MRRIYLNNQWIYYASWTDACLKTTVAAQGEKVRIPHTTAVLPYNYLNEADYQTVCGYMRMLAVPEAFRGKRLLLTFEGVAHVAWVYINGQLAAQHFCGYTAFTVDISDYVNYGCENRIVVKVDSRENQNVPPFGNVIDYLTYGGIYRDVYLEVKPQEYIEDVFVRTRNRYVGADGRPCAGHGPAMLSVSVRRSASVCGGTSGAEAEPSAETKSGGVIASSAETKFKVEMQPTDDTGDAAAYIQVSVFDDADNCIAVKRQALTHCVSNNSAAKSAVAVRFKLSDVIWWDVDCPKLYYAEVLLCGADGGPLDSWRQRFGFRDSEFRPDGFYLNRRKVKLIGLNRHQSYPYVGYAMPKSMQRLDAEILKEELAVNAVRTSHYPQSQHFIDRCDELGLLVFTEIPGWQHIGNAKWQSIAAGNVREMVAQYRNHPSVILWGVRINESADNDDLYLKTNAIARRMDPTRATGGVRNMKHSHLLEDVYTFNDFSHIGNNPGLLPKKRVTRAAAPYLVSEHNGHMYPVKMFDDEAQRVSQALRHASVLESALSDAQVTGCFGWCMADYQTHKDFGSGDGICYHGVLDMFRNPKTAAGVYASQGEQIVCEISSTMTPGDYPGAVPGKVWVFTNADFVRLYRNGAVIGDFYPDREHFGHLPHPPIGIDPSYMFGNGENWGLGAPVFRFDVIKDGHLIRRIIRRPAQGAYLDVICSHDRLVEGASYDVALLRIRAVDGQGLPLPYYNEPLRLMVWGPVALVGPDTISLKGGCGGAFVRTLGGEGPAKVTIFGNDMEPVEIYLDVIKE